jgi:hypothetical protein
MSALTTLCLRKLTEITDVSLRVLGSTVVLSERVEVGSSGGTSVTTYQLDADRHGLMTAYVLSPNSLFESAMVLE